MWPCGGSIQGVMAKSRAVCLLLLAVAVAAGPAYRVSPASDVPVAAYASWAHHHWVWLAHGGNGQSDCQQLLVDYQAHNITVGAVNIDSTWEQGFNNFEINTQRFPDAQAMVDFFHNNSVRVTFWITQMIDLDSPNYQEGKDNDYYLKDALGLVGVVKWWHGKGSLLDYTNPSAVNWWHAQMDIMLDLGIDGWKCDGTDPYIVELAGAKGFNGSVGWHEYSDMYYGDFFDYTRSKLGTDRLIMSRPVDAKGPFYVRFSPKRVMISGWVGDEDDTFAGLEGTLRRYLQSAWRGYANFGSDIGGYRTPQKPRLVDLFLRWTQLGAFSPLMENGGGGEHRPWLVDPSRAVEVTDIYRHFVDVHYALNAYLLSVGSAALENGTSSLHPLAPHNSTLEDLVDEFNPPTYCYLLGDRILVAPVLANTTAATGTAPSDVTFPTSGSWSYFFNTSLNYTGNGQKITLDVPLAEFTAFIKDGVILPLNLNKSVAGLGSSAHKGYLTATVIRPHLYEGDTYAVRGDEHTLDRGLGHRLSYRRSQQQQHIFTATAHPVRPTAWLLLQVPQPIAVRQLVDGGVWQAVEGATYDAKERTLTVFPSDAHLGSQVAVEW